MSPIVSFMESKGVLVQLTFVLWLLIGEGLIYRSAVLDRPRFHLRSKYMMVSMPCIYRLYCFFNSFIIIHEEMQYNSILLFYHKQLPQLYGDHQTVEPKESDVKEGNLNREKTIEVGQKLENGKWTFDEVSVTLFSIKIISSVIVFLSALYLSIPVPFF